MYPKITDLNASVEDPRIMGVIREQGGKVNRYIYIYILHVYKIQYIEYLKEIAHEVMVWCWRILGGTWSRPR